MIRYSQFRLAIVQAAVFTPDLGQFSQPNFLATILSRYAERFNGNVQALPFPENAPPEIPRLVLQSRDDVFKLQASPARIDSFWNSASGINRDKAFSCAEVLEHYVSVSKVTVGRLALIVTRLADDENPPQSLIERFCNKESRVRPFNRSESFEIHNQKVYELPDFGERINSWVRCKAVELITPEEKKVLVVEQDINTLQEDILQKSYNAEGIRRFFDAARQEADSILRIYFPEEA